MQYAVCNEQYAIASRVLGVRWHLWHSALGTSRHLTLDTMKLALIQQAVSSSHQESIERGIDALHQAVEKGADLVAYPELSFTPFFPQYRAGENVLDSAESIDGPTIQTFREVAARTGTVVILNVFERDGDRAFDSSPVIDADGSLLGVTRMAHITDYDCFYERGYYHPGNTLAPVYQTSVGRIGIAICYDRHYPEYMRSLALQSADLVVIPQAGISDEWPDGMYEGELQVSSFQNGYFCAMANRVGREDQLNFSGGSVVSDPWGRIVAQAPFNEDAILYADIDLGGCGESPARKLFLRDRRPELYEGGAMRINRARRS